MEEPSHFSTAAVARSCRAFPCAKFCDDREHAAPGGRHRGSCLFGAFKNQCLKCHKDSQGVRLVEIHHGVGPSCPVSLLWLVH